MHKIHILACFRRVSYCRIGMNISKMLKLKTRIVLLIIFAFVAIWTVFKFDGSQKNGGIKLRSTLINLNELRHIGECLLLEAGKEIVRIRRENENADTGFDLKKKSDNSVVTVGSPYFFCMDNI